MTTGFAPFDRTVQETNLWLKAVEATLGANRAQAYAAVRATFHVLRDRLPPAVALHFADQLPVLLRGVFVEGWKLAGKPTDLRSVVDFAEAVEAELPAVFPWDGEIAARAVLRTMITRTDVDEVAKIVTHMPVGLRELWAAEAV